jgi:hypothetical protein
LEVIGPIGLMLALQTVLESGYQPGAFCRCFVYSSLFKIVRLFICHGYWYLTKLCLGFGQRSYFQHTNQCQADQIRSKISPTTHNERVIAKIGRPGIRTMSIHGFFFSELSL